MTGEEAMLEMVADEEFGRTIGVMLLSGRTDGGEPMAEMFITYLTSRGVARSEAIGLARAWGLGMQHYGMAWQRKIEHEGAGL